MYSGFLWSYLCRKYSRTSPRKLKPLKILATNKENGYRTFWEFFWWKEELMKAMIASAGIPAVTQQTGADFWDGQFMLSLWEIAPEEIIIHGQNGIPRLTLSVSERVGSTIYLPNGHKPSEKVSGWRKLNLNEHSPYSPSTAQGTVWQRV